MAAFKIPTIYEAIDKFTSPIRRMQNANQSFIQSAESGVARVERFYRRLTPALSETTKQMFSFATAAALAGAVIAGISFSFQQIKEFDKSLASLRTITGQTKEEFEPLRKKIIEVAKDAKKSTVETAEAFNKIAALNAKFLESAEAIGMVSKATITLSKASGDELGPSAENLVSIMNQYSIAAEGADKAINILAAGAGIGAASIIQVAESFKNVGSVAKGANLSMEQTVAAIEVLGKYSIFGAEAGTKLRGVILQLQKGGLGYASGQFQINDALAEAIKKMDKLKTAKQKDAFMTKVFGAENITAGRIMLANIPLFDEFTKGVTGTNQAFVQAEIATNTLSSAIDELKASWVNVVTGSEKTTAGVDQLRDALKFAADHMETIVDWGSKILLFFVAWKAILIATRGALILYNIVLGITGALSGTASVAIGANAAALGAYKITLGIATAAQWLWNAALAANPIVWVVAAIVALIAVIVVVINKWNQWGAAVSLFLGPLGFVISLVQSFRRNWDMVKKAFSTGGILEGLKAIGKVMIDAVLMPLQQVLSLIAKFTGADWATSAVENIEKMRAGLGLNVTTDESGNPLPEVDRINPRVDEQNSFRETIDKQKQNVSMTINDKTGRAEVESDNDFMPIKLSTTGGFGGASTSW